MGENSSVNWGETLAGEMLVFRLLGKAFYEPAERTWLESLVAQDVFEESPLGASQVDVIAGLALLQSWSQANREGLTEAKFDELRAEYAQLFIGPGKVVAPPWESVYFGPERMLFQEQTIQVREWYRRFGLEMVKLYHEPDDHIAIEFGFIAHLAEITLHALERQDQKQFDDLLQAQQGFLQEHLSKWGPTWCELVNVKARTDFYRGMALLARGALTEMVSVLQPSPVQPVV